MNTAALPDAFLTRLQVEDFLHAENDMLDRWDLPSWYALFEADAIYEIVTPGIPNAETASADDTLLLISDDMDRLDQRLRRIVKKTAHVEFPRSQTSHMVTNIRVTEDDGVALVVKNRFLTFRTKSDRTVQFFGHQIYRLVRRDAGLRIRSKRTILDFDSLGQQGKLTIVL